MAAGEVRSAILMVVNAGYSTPVMDTAYTLCQELDVPAEIRRATHAEAYRTLGVSVQAGDGKELVLILAPDAAATQLASALRREWGAHTEAGGVLFTMAIKSAEGPD